VSNIIFYKPQSLSQASEILSQPDHMAVNGGTDLIVKIRNGLYPDLKGIVDISALPLNSISRSATHLTIGSGCTMSQVINDPVINEHFPVLVRAASTVGALQIRNAATIGGNVANASPAGDTIPALLTLEAEVVISDAGGSRTVPISQFFTGPGKTVMKPGELIESFKIMLRRTKGTFLKLGERRAHAISKINMAVCAWNDGTWHYRIAMGSVAPTVLRCNEAEALLEKSAFPLSSEVISQAARLAEETARPISDVRSTQAYRKKMAGVLLKRSLEELVN